MIRRSLGVFFNLVFVYGLGLVGSVIAARLLGPEQRGLVAVGSICAMLVMSLADLGLRSAIVFNLPKAGGAGRAAQVGLAIGVRAVLVALVLGAGLYLGGYALGRTTFLKGVTPGLALLSFALCMANLGQDVVACTLMGLKDFRGRNLMTCLPPVLTLVALGCWWASLGKLGAGSMIAIQVVSLLASGAAGLLYFRRAHRPALDLRLPAGWRREYLWFGARNCVSYTLFYLNYRVDALIVNALLGNREVGLYSAAVAVAELVQQAPTAVTLVLQPELGTLDDRARVRASLMALGASLYVVGAGCVFLAVILPWALPLYYGAAFASAVPAAFWLLPGMAGLTVLRVVSVAAAAQDRPEYRMYASLVGLAGTLVLDFLLIPRFGIVGAAWASSITYWAAAFCMLALFMRQARVAPGEFAAAVALDPVRWLAHRLRPARVGAVDLAT